MAKPKNELVKAVHPAKPNFEYYLHKGDKELVANLLKPQIFPKGCEKVRTKTITLFPKTNVQGGTGQGYHMINVNGYRYLNVYVISDPLNSTTQNGFSLEISFSLNDFVYGVGVIGETSHFFNFDTYYNPGEREQRLIHSSTSDKTSTGGLPWIGGTDLTHILRIPIMGPYVRASVFNEDSQARHAEVKAYLTT
jgi:hypothetical protein